MTELVRETVEFPANGGTALGYLVHPEDDGPFPGVVVIQEFWGMNNQIKGVADRFAREGFAAVVPDLYRGQVAQEPDEARKLAMMLDRAQAVKDIQGAVDYLSALPFVQPPSIGVMGFCMGGALALAMSYAGKNVGASVVFYGGGPVPEDEALQRVSAPILGLYGAEDHGIPVERVRELESKLQAFGKTAEIVIYEGTGHAFFNEERPVYRPEAAEDAWQRTLAWLRTHLPTTT